MSRKYFAKTFTRDKNHKNIEKRNDKPLKETRISKNVEKWGEYSHLDTYHKESFRGGIILS